MLSPLGPLAGVAAGFLGGRGGDRVGVWKLPPEGPLGVVTIGLDPLETAARPCDVDGFRDGPGVGLVDEFLDTVASLRSSCISGAPDDPDVL